MKDFSKKSLIKLIIYSPLILLVLTGCRNSSSHQKDIYNSVISSNNLDRHSEIAVEAPPFNEEGIFPCSDCHADEETNTIRRKLDMHEEVDESFNHDNENRWCLDCHNVDDRDYLKLASGKLIDFEESYKLCGQCHGDKLRDWKVGVHGKRTGEWNGKKQYLLCVHCHDPHSPKFNPIKPLPPPVRQKDIY